MYVFGKSIAMAIVFLNATILYCFCDDPKPMAASSNASSSDLCSILITQLTPTWEEQSLGQSAATAGSTEYHVVVAASQKDLVLRQRVLLNSSDGGSIKTELDASGGIIKLSDIATNSVVTTIITVEFLPASKLPALMKRYTSTSTKAGSIGLFQLLSDETTCFVDPGGWPKRGDYLTCNVSVTQNGQNERQVQHLLKMNGATPKHETAEFVIIRDRETDNVPTVSIAGRLGNAKACVLGEFNMNELQSAGALIPVWVCEKSHIVFRPVGNR